jgi:hypothetical protein
MKTFLSSVGVRLTFVLLVPLKYSHSQGFIGSQTTVYAMLWTWDGGPVFHSRSVLTALLISAPAILFVLSLKRASAGKYPVKTALASSAFLLLIPFLEIPNLFPPDTLIATTPYLAPFGFCSLLWLMFVFVPSFLFHVDPRMATSTRSFKAVALTALGLTLLLPFLDLEYHGVLGFDESYFLGFLLQVRQGRWGLTNEMNISCAEPLAEFSSLSAYAPLMLLTMPRMLFFLYLTNYFAGRASLIKVLSVGLLQEMLSGLYALFLTSMSTPPLGTTRFVLPIPILLPLALLLLWVVRVLSRSMSETPLDEEDLVVIPLLVRAESQLRIRGRRKLHSDTIEKTSSEENNKTTQQP